jgi:cell division transport system ATP-binding protein
VKKRIGYVAENPVFIEQWTAFDNIAMPLRMAGHKPREYADDVRELVDFVGLGNAADLRMEKLSGAERRRVAIARALANKPELILADDPTANMSPADGRRVVKLLSEMRRVGTAVVIASQDESLGECAPMRRWRMDHGRLSPVDHAAPEAAEAME